MAPRARVVYLDADPIVMAHQQALAVSGPLGAIGFLAGDLAEPEQILAALAEDGTLDLSRPIALVLGGEGEGMRRLTREACDFVAKIPMRGDVESLNVSVSTGIVLFEALRQRGA